MTVVSWLLFFSLLWLFAGSVVLIRNRIDLPPLPAASESLQARPNPRVSLLIPARNEEKQIENVVRSACSQYYEPLEVLVLDDNSTDRTGEILQKLKQEYAGRLKILCGKPKPDGWLGKPWACRQLADQAEGIYLLFIDADVLLEPGTVGRAVQAMINRQLDLLTLWPQQMLYSFWEKAVIPVVYHALVTMLPAAYVYRKPRWMPGILYSRLKGAFAAACGQFMMFRTEAYEQIGGHTAVKGQIVEDVELAKKVKEAGFIIQMYEGMNSVRCRMYGSGKELFYGFRKNFFAGFRYSWPLFILFGLIHLAVYILPFLLLPAALWILHPLWLFLSTVAISLILIQRLILAVWFGWNPLYALTHPIGVSWFQILGLLTMYDRLSGRKTHWKGRQVG